MLSAITIMLACGTVAKVIDFERGPHSYVGPNMFTFLIIMIILYFGSWYLVFHNFSSFNQFSNLDTNNGQISNFVHYTRILIQTILCIYNSVFIFIHLLIWKELGCDCTNFCSIILFFWIFKQLIWSVFGI